MTERLVFFCFGLQLFLASVANAQSISKPSEGGDVAVYLTDVLVELFPKEHDFGESGELGVVASYAVQNFDCRFFITPFCQRELEETGITSCMQSLRATPDDQLETERLGNSIGPHYNEALGVDLWGLGIADRDIEVLGWLPIGSITPDTLVPPRTCVFTGPLSTNNKHWQELTEREFGGAELQWLIDFARCPTPSGRGINPECQADWRNR